ncbi:hypothetical protein [Salinibaculum salinum]|uniref:hypothetical protein n=1 Tax=Salinibaculum salinum TaxID=3131996 RepID=UPI0030EBDC63
MPSTRRTVLASLGTAFVSAGCLASADDQNGSPGETPETESPASMTEDPYADTPETRGRFADNPCPSFAETDRTICTHSREDNDIYLVSSSQLLRPDPSTDIIETITFTLYNERDQPFSLNPHAWQIQAKQNGQWSPVAPDVHVEPMAEVPAGGSYEWVLSQRPYPTANGDRQVHATVDLEPGRHAFAIDGWFDSMGEETESESVECLALFDVADIVGE